MSISSKEQKELIRLMNKVYFPLPRSIFNSWCGNFTIYTVEIALIRKSENRYDIFLIYRNDKFFKGWHIPGSVVLPGDTVDQALQRVINKEICTDVSKPKFLYWFERFKGIGLGQSPRGQELALVFVSKQVKEVHETDKRKFFPLANIPKDILSQYIVILEKLREYTIKL